jgi:hypothetical protein
MSTGAMSDLTPGLGQKSAQQYMDVLKSLVDEIAAFLPDAAVEEDENNE